MKPEEFVELQAEAEQIGFAGVMSGPLVRSSYRAGRLYQQARRGSRQTSRLSPVSCTAWRRTAAKAPRGKADPKAKARRARPRRRRRRGAQRTAKQIDPGRTG